MATEKSFNNPKWHQLTMTLVVLMFLSVLMATETIFNEWIVPETPPAEWADIVADTIFYFLGYLLLITPVVLVFWNLIISSTFELPKLTYRQGVIICTFYLLLTIE